MQSESCVCFVMMFILAHDNLLEHQLEDAGEDDDMQRWWTSRNTIFPDDDRPATPTIHPKPKNDLLLFVES